MDTRIIETPFKKFKVELKNYLTARDEFEIQRIMYDSAEVKAGAIDSLKSSTGDVMIAMEKKILEKAVVSINDNSENVIEKLLDMPSQDYDFVRAEIDKIRKYADLKKK